MDSALGHEYKGSPRSGSKRKRGDGLAGGETVGMDPNKRARSDVKEPTTTPMTDVDVDDDPNDKVNAKTNTNTNTNANANATSSLRAITQQLTCTLCLVVPLEPMMPECQHLLCSVCMDGPFKQKPGEAPCPTCRQPMKKADILPLQQRSRALWAILCELRIQCGHDECGWSGRHADWKRHCSEECDARQMRCPTCPATGTPAELRDQHQCPNEILACPCCSDPFPRHELADHHPSNPNPNQPDACATRAPCPRGCGQAFRRTEVQHHLATSCPLELVPCLWCKEVMPRKALDAHDHPTASDSQHHSVAGARALATELTQARTLLDQFAVGTFSVDQVKPDGTVQSTIETIDRRWTANTLVHRVVRPAHAGHCDVWFGSQRLSPSTPLYAAQDPNAPIVIALYPTVASPAPTAKPSAVGAPEPPLEPRLRLVHVTVRRGRSGGSAKPDGGKAAADGPRQPAPTSSHHIPVNAACTPLFLLHLCQSVLDPTIQKLRTRDGQTLLPKSPPLATDVQALTAVAID